MQRLYIKICIAVVAALVAAAPIEAKKKKKKGDVEVVLLTPERPADELKALPDATPRRLTKPMIASLGMPTGTGLTGIDVSHYQGVIDWRQVAQDPQVHYVYLKATESNTMVDDTYERNLAEARRQGLKVGSYHFFRPAVSGRAQFDLFSRVVNRKHQDLLPIVDVEVAGNVAITVWHSRLLELLQLITKQYGRKPLIYTGKNFYNKYFADYALFRGYPFMIAQYSGGQPVLSNDDDYIIWQYSCKGRVKGIKGDVDQSRFVGRHGLSEILLK